MKIGIISNFMEFNPGYSLTGIVQDQIEMLQRHGDEVTLFVNSQYHGENVPCEVRAEIPFTHLVDYKSEKDITPEHLKLIADNVPRLREIWSEYDVLFTHDFIFQGWFLPYCRMVLEAGLGMPEQRWFHWIHSVPTSMRDWWVFPRYGRKHRIVYPNKTDALRVAEQFRGVLENVRVIPHIKDPRSWFDFGEETRSFIDQYPAVIQADIVQILPASVDRLLAKRVREVIQMFSEFKKSGFSTCLVVANQWATTRQHKESIETYKLFGKSRGMEPEKDLVFTSDFQPPKYEAGIPRRMVRELFQLSNLFIFPTREESFGLVVPEAALSSGGLLVLNKSLQQQIEISGMTALYFDFGSFHTNHTISDPDMYYKEVAQIIVGRMRMNECLVTKTFMRQAYNMDTLYTKHYGPLMAESLSW